MRSFMTSYLPATDSNTDRTRPALSAAATFSKPKFTVCSSPAMLPFEDPSLKPFIVADCAADRPRRQRSGRGLPGRVARLGAALPVAGPIRAEFPPELVQNRPRIQTRGMPIL